MAFPRSMHTALAGLGELGLLWRADAGAIAHLRIAKSSELASMGRGFFEIQRERDRASTPAPCVDG